MFAHFASVNLVKVNKIALVADWPRVIAIVLVVLILANILTFIIVRLILDPKSFQGCDLELVRDAPPGEIMNYLIAGTYNQPGAAYDFLMDDLPGGITLVNFQTSGWSARQMAETIHTDIVFERYYHKVRIITISVGDQVARYLEQMLSDYPNIQLEIIAINPCPSPIVLNDSTFYLAHLAATLLQIGRVLTGWLSMVPTPLLSTPGGDYSLCLLTDQVEQVLNPLAPFCIDHTTAIVISQEDQLLDNDEVKEFFPKSWCIEMLRVDHGDTISNAADYHDAVMRALKHSKF